MLSVVVSLVESVAFSHVIAAVSALYLINYIKKIQRPQLFCGEGKWKKKLMTGLKMLQEPYYPTFWLYLSHANTVIGHLMKKKESALYQREILHLSDGGVLALDWAHVKDPKSVVMIIPGLTGNSQSHYICHLVNMCVLQGCTVVVFNYRGTCGVELRTNTTYSATWKGDIAEAVKNVRSVYSLPLVVVGSSLGGMILLNYLATHGTDSGVDFAITISSAFDVMISAAEMEKPINKYTLNYYLARMLVGQVERYTDRFKLIVDMEATKKSRTIRDFDTNFTSKVFGYKDVLDYYKDASNYGRIPVIKTPTVCLNAADDMMSPPDGLPTKFAEDNPNVAMVVTKCGGHLGFCEGIWPTGSNWADRFLSEFVALVSEEREVDLGQM